MCERRILARGTRCAPSSSSGTPLGPRVVSVFIHGRGGRAAAAAACTHALPGGSRNIWKGERGAYGAASDAERAASAGEAQIWLSRRGPAAGLWGGARAERETDDGHGRLCARTAAGRALGIILAGKRGAKARTCRYLYVLRRMAHYDATVSGQKG